MTKYKKGSIFSLSSYFLLSWNNYYLTSSTRFKISFNSFHDQFYYKNFIFESHLWMDFFFCYSIKNTQKCGKQKIERSCELSFQKVIYFQKCRYLYSVNVDSWSFFIYTALALTIVQNYKFVVLCLISFSYVVSLILLLCFILIQPVPVIWLFT